METFGAAVSILPTEEFLERLRFEKRRTDRSKTPLSLALFSLKEDSGGDVRLLREILISIKRDLLETELIGWVNGKSFGILLLDTAEPEARQRLELLVKDRDWNSCEVLTGTYPDRLFAEILGKIGAEPRIFTLESLEPWSDSSGQQHLKRGLDFIGALTGLVLFFPVLLITALAIKLTSPGPIIVRQTRLGLQGTPFNFLKFRSGQLKNESCFTPVGRIIRRLGLDRLPHFFNVLKGELSLVGPRPPRPDEVGKYQSWHLRRFLEVKPGLTGIWQAKEGGRWASFEELVRQDIRYGRNRSLGVDFKILAETVREALRPARSSMPRTGYLFFRDSRTGGSGNSIPL